MSGSITTVQCEARPPRRISAEAWLLGLVLISGLLLESPDGVSVRLRGLPEIELPEVCAARRWFGWKCPLCGATRSCLYLLQGRWSEAWAMHRLGWLCLGVIVTTGVVALASRTLRIRGWSWSQKFTYGCWTATVFLLLLNRLLEICGI